MDQLPVDCISCILAFTSPKDVCRLAGVSSAFRSAADSDLLWTAFLPKYYREIIAQSSSSSFLNSLREKDLYFHLSDNPLLIDSENSSFSLEKESGISCYMVGLKNKSMPETSFSVQCGIIDTNKLTPKTYYGIYLDFKCKKEDYSETIETIRSCIYMKGAKANWEKLLFEDSTIESREDGWIEIEISQIFIKGDKNIGSFGVSICIHTIFNDEIVFKGFGIRPSSKKWKENQCNDVIWFAK